MYEDTKTLSDNAQISEKLSYWQEKIRYHLREKRVHVLLADNHPGYLETTTEILKKEGFQVSSASSPSDAKAVLAEGTTEVLVTDIRLKDDNDNCDASGYWLAKETDPLIPKILITGKTTPDVVRDALKPSNGNTQPNLAMIAKNDGKQKLPQQILMAVVHPDPQIEENVLQEFGGRAMIELRGKMDTFGLDDSLQLLRKGLAEAVKDLAKERDAENRRILQYHYSGLAASWLVMALMITAIIAVIAGGTPAAVLTLIGGVITKAAHPLFSRGEDNARKAKSDLDQRLERTKSHAYSVEWAGSIGDVKKREEALNLIISQICLNER